MSASLRWKKKIFEFILALTFAPQSYPQKVFMAKAASEITGEELPLRLKDVKGFEERKNDIIYYRKDFNKPLHSRVVYFGGDVQDYPENMLSHRDNKRFEQWNLINTAVLLGHHFPASEVYIVKPVRMQFKTFSCYDNFIIANEVGAPNHIPNNNAIKHLQILLSNAMTYIRSYYCSQKIHDSETCSSVSASKKEHLLASSQSKIPIVLIGFSKGCVVLNQFLYEFHLQDVDKDIKNFIQNITDIYWLDGGHPGGNNTWITKKEILERLANTDIRVHIYMTPFQLNDLRRPWLRKEEKIFSNTLSKMNAKIQRFVLFNDQPGDISLHFQLLKQFKMHET